MHLSLIDRSNIRPITLDELKTHCVIDHNLDDGVLTSLLDEAVEQVEADTGRTLVDTIWGGVMESFPSVIYLPRPPVVELISITYVDASGQLQTLPEHAYQVLATAAGAEVRPAPGLRWPAVQAGNVSAVAVRYRAGYVLSAGFGEALGAGSGTALVDAAGQLLLSGGATQVGEIPMRARLAALIWAAHLYENREHMSPVQLHELPSYRSLLSTLETGLV